jgi:hypothetical protein
MTGVDIQKTGLERKCCKESIHKFRAVEDIGREIGRVCSRYDTAAMLSMRP